MAILRSHDQYSPVSVLYVPVGTLPYLPDSPAVINGMCRLRSEYGRNHSSRSLSSSMHCAFASNLCHTTLPHPLVNPVLPLQKTPKRQLAPSLPNQINQRLRTLGARKTGISLENSPISCLRIRLTSVAQGISCFWSYTFLCRWPSESSSFTSCLVGGE